MHFEAETENHWNILNSAISRNKTKRGKKYENRKYKTNQLSSFSSPVVKHSYDPTIDRCDNTFRGFGAFSEVETRNVRNYLNSLGKNLKGFLDFHDDARRAFQMPWKYTYGSNPDKAEQVRLFYERNVSQVLEY